MHVVSPMTLPPVVAALTRAHLALLDAALPGLVDGLHLHGSLGFGEFFGGSDVDVVVVTSRRVEPDEVDVLRRVHAELGRRWESPAYDGFYVTAEDLRGRPEQVPPVPGALDGWFDVGTHGDASHITWRELRDHAVTLRGTAPRDLGVWSDDAALHEATRVNLDTYWRGQLEALRHHPREAALPQAAEWGALGAARLHHLLVTGRPTSKSGGGRWALEAFPAHEEIVREGLRVREQPDAPTTYAADPARRARDLIALVAEVVDDGVARTRAAAGANWPAAAGALVSDAGPAEWVIELGDVESEESRALLLDYYTEVSDRWYQLREGRDTTEAELEAGFPQMRSDGLAPPTGVFLVARSPDGSQLGGCIGLQRSRTAAGERVGDVRRMYVRPAMRGSGLAPSLLACVEEVARAWGLAALRLDTRRDLVEALSLYRRNGWVDVPAFTDNAYAEVWLGKRLT